MSWVKEADLPELPEIFKAISSNSYALELVEQLNEGIAFGSSSLTRTQEEAIATVVSAANHCRYGALTHGAFFRKHSGDSATASQLLADHTQADLSTSDQVMLGFSAKLTLNPANMTEQDVEGLREAGFGDDQIVSIVLVTCLFNFMNRIANSLGVAVPRPFTRSVGTWLTVPAAEEEWLLGGDARLSVNLNWKGLEKALGEISKTTQLQVTDSEAQDTPAEEAPSDPVTETVPTEDLAGNSDAEDSSVCPQIDGNSASNILDNAPPVV